MADKTAANIKFWIALFFAIWFLITGSVWVYWGALVIAYPFGITSAILWYLNRNKPGEAKRYKITGWVLLVGFVISLAVLIALLITN